MSAAACARHARRAVRFGLPLSLADHLPDIAAYYRELCSDAGPPADHHARPVIAE